MIKDKPKTKDKGSSSIISIRDLYALLFPSLSKYLPKLEVDPSIQFEMSETDIKKFEKIKQDIEKNKNYYAMSYAMKKDLEYLAISKKGAKEIIRTIYELGNELKKSAGKIDKICGSLDRMHYSVQELKKKAQKYGYRV